MSILVVSVSHKSTSVAHLGQLALDAGAATKLADQLVSSEHIDEAVVLSTCNRTELYASVSRFHGALDDATNALADLAGLPVVDLQARCAVYFDEGAVAHTFAVAAGLDSVVIGESQILGQVKNALTMCQNHGTVGTVLNSLVSAGPPGRQAGAGRDRDRRGRALAGQCGVPAADPGSRRARGPPGAGGRRGRHGRSGRPDRRRGGRADQLRQPHPGSSAAAGRCRRRPRDQPAGPSGGPGRDRHPRHLHRGPLADHHGRRPGRHPGDRRGRPRPARRRCARRRLPRREPDQPRPAGR